MAVCDKGWIRTEEAHIKQFLGSLGWGQGSPELFEVPDGFALRQPAVELMVKRMSGMRIMGYEVNASLMLWSLKMSQAIDDAWIRKTGEAVGPLVDKVQRHLDEHCRPDRGLEPVVLETWARLEDTRFAHFELDLAQAGAADERWRATDHLLRAYVLPRSVAELVAEQNPTAKVVTSRQVLGDLAAFEDALKLWVPGGDDDFKDLAYAYQVTRRL